MTAVSFWEDHIAIGMSCGSVFVVNHKQLIYQKKNISGGKVTAIALSENILLSLNVHGKLLFVNQFKDE